MIRSMLVLCAGVVALSGLATGASAAVVGANGHSAAQRPRPLFVVLPHKNASNAPAALGLPNWTFTYSHGGTSYSDVFLGSAPSGGGSTTIPTEIIPVKLKYGTTVENPLKKIGGVTLVQNTVNSPLFQNGIDFNQGGTDLGSTQYEDAVQRASFWGITGTNPSYHVLLGQPTVEPVLTLTVPLSQGTLTKDFGVSVLNVNINWFDSKIQSALGGVSSSVLPIYMITNTYLVDPQCCIGGYHNYASSKVYDVFTYIQKSGAFSEDVSALSHELGETINDPTTTNSSPCGIYETGDPLENEANYGTYPYGLGGFTYHLQDLALPPYFGAPATTSVNHWSTFQGTSLSVCQNGA